MDRLEVHVVEFFLRSFGGNAGNYFGNDKGKQFCSILKYFPTPETAFQKLPCCNFLLLRAMFKAYREAAYLLGKL
jgi:hypothetical protein